MQQMKVREKSVDVALFQFILPFSFKAGTEKDIIPILLKDDYKHFQLKHEEDENRYYGQFCVSHQDMRSYFLPFTNKILFPSSEYEKGIQRYSKALNIHGVLMTDLIKIPFQILSIDINLCPYELGFLTIRTELMNSDDLTISNATEFAARFRVLEPKNKRDLQTEIECDGKIFKQVSHFVLDHLYQSVMKYFTLKDPNKAHFKPFPFFEDARMYVQSFISIKETSSYDLVDVYRGVGLCGLSNEGKPYVSANNLPYITDYLQKHSYHRWEPNTFFTMEEHSFICMTNENSEKVTQLISQVYGEFYYALLLNLFHKIVLLKIAHSFADLNIDRDEKEMERLIYAINSFTANYFFSEIASQSQGRDIYNHLRRIFNIELLYNDAKQTLYSLFKYQENANTKKDSLLLLILTLYSVIGQMFGMSVVIGDFAGKINWRHILNYNPLEYFALFVAMSGVIVSLILGFRNIYQWSTERQERKKWVEQTVLSSTKDKG
ncbi:hypothetical protein HPT25_19150 [Bacillus sp. BRMEA1]|uniref:hypothetical protein n=1 Tax=Neobacillus endophyticus TaxID=2738405 RepID=UPI001564D73C|nr:hypothetical protein [Neobacillus endophyticus]NRD79483.1 hypothetical protein [Neobacillus endophyticus]